MSARLTSRSRLTVAALASPLVLALGACADGGGETAATEDTANTCLLYTSPSPRD